MRHPLLLLILAFVVWSGTFLLVYATQATGCSLGWHNNDIAFWRSPLRFILIVLVVISFVAILGTLAWLRRRHKPSAALETSTFLGQVKTYVTIAAIFSTAFCFAGVFWLTLCPL